MRLGLFITKAGPSLNTVMPVFEKIQAMTDFTQHGKAWMDRYLA